MISLICPTRGRPEMCKRMVASARANSYSKIEVLLGIGGEDTENTFKENYYGYDITGIDQTILTGTFPVVYVVNDLARWANGDIIFLAGDDTVFATPGWDKAIQDHYDALVNKIHVYSLLDSRGENGTPHPAATRQYVKAMGYFYTPIFNHFYPDTWLVDIAKSNGCFTHLKDYLLIHDKPSDKGIQDETFKRVRASGWLNRDQKVNETCQHFLELEKQRLGKVMV